MAITQYIPQRPPFVMVDHLLMYNPEEAYTCFLLTEDNPLLNGETFPVGGLVENVAQSCAAWIGKILTDRGLPIRLGYLGAVSGMNVEALPHVGDTLFTTIQVLDAVEDITMVEASVRTAHHRLLATLKMKIVLQ